VGEETQARLRNLPAVDRLAAEVGSVSAARAVIDGRRAELLAGATDDVDLAARARERCGPSLRRVLNATGVVVHTNLGRAPLAPAARDAVARAAEGYGNLELDLAAASAARARTTSRGCCARSPAPRRRSRSTTARRRRCSRSRRSGAR
jgi:hypothetical protein